MARNLLKDIPVLIPKPNKQVRRVTDPKGATFEFDGVDGHLTAIEYKNHRLKLDKLARVTKDISNDGAEELYDYDSPGYALKITRIKDGAKVEEQALKDDDPTLDYIKQGDSNEKDRAMETVQDAVDKLSAINDQLQSFKPGGPFPGSAKPFCKNS